MTTFYYKILLFSFMLSACEPSLKRISEDIVLGDTYGMLISSYDVLLDSKTLENDSLLIDIYKDGEVDLMIESFWCTYLGGGASCSGISFQRRSEDFELGGIVRIDTTYERVEIEVDTFLELDSIKIVKTVYSSCENTHEDFEIHHITEPVFHLKYFSVGDQINNNTVFAKENYSFRNRRTTSRIGYCSQVGEISYQTVIDNYDRTCYNYPELVDWYVPFRIERRDNYRLGWIKVQYLGNDRIRIIEIAIQE